MSTRNKKRTREYFIEVARQIETIPAIKANSIGYIAKLMINASFPSKDPHSNEFDRYNGDMKLSMHAPSDIGVPFGTIPRVLLISIVTEAKINKSREVYLGESMTDFLRNLGKRGSGGPSGSITHLKKQSRKLFSSTITVTHKKENHEEVSNISFAQHASMLWQPQEKGAWSSHLKLSESFYEDICQSAVPIDLRVIQACSHYPLAIDTYCWLTYRNYSLKKPVYISWKQLAMQFGNQYTNERKFKPKFIAALDRVKLFYPGAKFSHSNRGLLLLPSPTHVPKET